MKKTTLRTAKTLLSSAIIASTLLAIPLFAQQVATLADGRKVILHDNGSWKIATQSDLVSLKLMSSGTGASPGVAGGGASTGQNGNDLIPGGGTAAAPAGGTAAGGRPAPVVTDQQRGSVSLLTVLKKDAAFDFRKTNWGMNRQNVKKSEEAQFVSEESNKLEYKITLLGLSGRIVYAFINDQLVSASYQLEQNHVDPSLYFQDYLMLKDYLRQTYGAPQSDQDMWTNEIYKADRRNWGFAISIGFLTYRTIWQSPNTKISLNIKGGNHTISSTIEFCNTK